MTDQKFFNNQSHGQNLTFLNAIQVKGFGQILEVPNDKKQPTF